MHDFHVQSFSFLGRLESVIHLTDELITKQCPACLVIDGLVLAMLLTSVSISCCFGLSVHIIGSFRRLFPMWGGIRM